MTLCLKHLIFPHFKYAPSVCYTLLGRYSWLSHQLKRSGLWAVKKQTFSAVATLLWNSLPQEAALLHHCQSSITWQKWCFSVGLLLILSDGAPLGWGGGILLFYILLLWAFYFGCTYLVLFLILLYLYITYCKLP